MDEHHHESHGRHAENRGVVGATLSVVESFFDFLTGSLRTIGHNKEIFLGVALTTIGLLSFKSDKFCDGNTADYLSCTRPSTYYFYSPVGITIVVIGVFLIMIWFLNVRRTVR